MREQPPTSTRDLSADRARRVLFGLGLLVSFVMVLRSQVSEDQFYLLVRGWILIRDGWLVPFGNPMSGGGFEPGSLTSLLVGVPLLLWEDFRAVSLSILLTHVAAYLLLDRTVRDVLDARGRLLLCLFYWMNPWRMYFSGYLWNPNWLFLLGVVHLWTAKRSSRRASFVHSLVHVLCVGFAFQIHGSFLILVIASALLYVRGFLRVHWAGAALGVVLIGASLVPWMITVAEHPEILPISEGFPGRGLVLVYPMLKGAVYWLRYPALFFWTQMTDLDFTPTLGPRADGILTPALLGLTRVIGPLTVIVSLVANLRLWRRPRAALRRFPADRTAREWLKGYVRWTFLAAMISFALSPTEVMSWQALIVLHAAVLAMVLWVEVLWRSRVAGRVTVALRIHAVVLVVLVASMALAAPVYRSSGREAPIIAVPEPLPMLEELGVTKHCTVFVSPGGSRSKLLRGRERWADGLVAGEEM